MEFPPLVLPIPILKQVYLTPQTALSLSIVPAQTLQAQKTTNLMLMLMTKPLQKQVEY